MSISFIKPEMLLPEREIIINKSFILHGEPALIASITEKEGILKLWIFHKLPESAHSELSNEYSIKCVTNRDEIFRRTSNINTGYVHISEISIQGISLPFSRSSSAVVGYNHTGHMKLQHFVEAGVDFSLIEDVSLNHIILYEYLLTEGMSFPKINESLDMTVSLGLSEESIETLVEPPHLFRLEIGEQTEKEAYSFYDSVENKEVFYYINNVVRYDIWKETEERFRERAALDTSGEQGIDNAAIERMLESVCPKGHELLLIKYECQDNIQLNFYATDFLDSKVVTSSRIGCILFGSSDDKGLHGYNVRSCLIKPVPSGFSESVEVELISWHRRIPGEKIEV